LTLIKPFRALRPAPGRAVDVLAPPYDVLSSMEARDGVKGKPWSFLHVSKAEIDLDPAIDPYDRAVYARAAENLRRMIAAGVLVRDDKPCYLRLPPDLARSPRDRLRGDRVDCGLCQEPHPQARADDDGEGGRPRAPDRGGRCADWPGHAGLSGGAQDRRPARGAPPAKNQRSTSPPTTGLRHQLWVIDDEATIAALTRAVDALPALYIADGHHRSAAALRVAQARGQKDGYFLAVLLPQQQMTILDYNRVLRDLNGLYPRRGLKKIGHRYAVEPSHQPVRPARAGEVGMILGGRWYQSRAAARGRGRERAKWRPGSRGCRSRCSPKTSSSRFSALPDPRRDKRIEFVGGGSGLGELERLVSSGAMVVAFALYPTQMSDLMAVADAGAIMPPKSTWFEPKLADGMVSHLLD